MASRVLKEGEVQFQTEGRLLQELGERLVASPEVALVELVKNSYDADATECKIEVDAEGKVITLADNGSGMSFDDFANRWMRIATGAKLGEKKSPRYGRRVTGQKGIGRFAVRFIGKVLELDTVGMDSGRGLKTRLTATFNWTAIDLQHDLAKAKIPFKLVEVNESTPTGVTLRISDLRMDSNFVRSEDFRTKVIRIVSPIQGLEPRRFGRSTPSSRKDPGFRALLPGDDGSTETSLNLAETLLEHAWARLEIELENGQLEYVVQFRGESKLRRLKMKYETGISKGCRADIRFFPKRKGVFKARGVNGRVAWTWVKDNRGVAVIDHGFRVKPFGFPEDDWLKLDADGARNEREWRSAIARERFPIVPRERNDPAINPALNLPSNGQLIGATFVESKPPALAAMQVDLIPSMDREGFLDNDAFRQLAEVVRGGIEFLAAADKTRLIEEKERVAREAARQMRADLKSAIEYIEQSPTLSRADKTRISTHYSELAKRLDQVQEYDQEARQKLEIMSSLGVLAGFMTHEAAQAATALEQASDVLSRLWRRHPQLKEHAQLVADSKESMNALLDYARSFVDATHMSRSSSFKAAPQIRRVIATLRRFTDQRKILVKCEVDSELEVPPMPVTVYSGVLLNLLTNALKSILALKHMPAEALVVFRARNDSRGHIVDVLDTGIGIPPELRSRIFDPLFTTTSRMDNPLGSGMGLGLTLVRQLVVGLGGRIDVVDAPEGFSTCIRVRFLSGKQNARK